MTPKEIEKRLDSLENRTASGQSYVVWVNFVGNDKKSWPVKGYRCGDHTFLREPDETDEGLKNRVFLLSEQYINPPNARVFIPVV